MKNLAIGSPALGILLVFTSVSQARWLNANSGRFQTMDSFEGNPQEPPTLHRYIYAANNPVNLFDPSGHDFELGGLLGVMNIGTTFFAQIPGFGSSIATPRQPASQFSLSPQGLQLIAGFESFSGKIYQDAAGYDTIGFGHKLKSGEHTTYAAGINPDQGMQVLRSDSNASEKTVGSAVTAPINQFENDALVSFTFNVGGPNLRSSTLLTKLNQRDYEGASREFTRWVFAGGKELAGLRVRREKEQILFRGESWRFRGELGFDPY
jgi:GH24 family phage-related lysozyme (muramidase)